MLYGTVQWRIPCLVPRIHEAFEAHEVTHAELAAKHGGVVHGSPALGVHRVHIESLFDKICQAERLVTLGCHMKHIHPTFILLVHVPTILDQQAHECQIPMIRGELQRSELVASPCPYIQPVFQHLAPRFTVIRHFQVVVQRELDEIFCGLIEALLGNLVEQGEAMPVVHCRKVYLLF